MSTRRAFTSSLLGATLSLATMTKAEAAAHTRIVAFQTSPFPYDGVVPASGEPFFDTTQDGERGHTSPRGGVYLESETYSDRSVLLAIAPRFRPRKAVIVVFLHGNGSKLIRDVVHRQEVVTQFLASKLNAALVVPQFAVDALDSSAGHFWDIGGFERFMHEAGRRLGAMAGTSHTAFDAMPIVLVAYSGGYYPTAAILRHGGVDDRLKGLILLDALYGEQSTYVDWIMRHHRRAFFFSAFSKSSEDGNISAEAELEARGLTLIDGLPAQLKPGVVAFQPAGDVPHNDFVTQAWETNPLRAVLARVAV